MITQDDVIYFIITDRFFDAESANNDNVDKNNPEGLHGGDFKGIESKIDYLVALGITAIWITPVYENVSGMPGGQPYHYYWPKDFDKVDEHLYSKKEKYSKGDKRYLRDFVDNCHKKGIKVILDVVVNHTGYDNGKPVFSAEWYRNDDEGVLLGLPKLNLANPNVVDYFIRGLEEWIEITGIDGLRMDMAKYIGGYYKTDPKNNGQEILVDEDFSKFWYYYKSIIKGRFPNLFIVGEVLNSSVNDIDENAVFQNQFDLTSIFDFPLTQTLKDTFIHNGSLKLLARPRLNENEKVGVLDRDDPSKNGYYTNANRLVTLLDNHDLERRIISEIRLKYSGDDNKAFAFRICEMCNAFLFTIRGIPQIYYGSEVGLEGSKSENQDVDLRRDFPWYRVDKNNNVINEFGLEKSLFLKIKQLIHLRKGSGALKYGVTITLWVDDFVFAFLRFYNDEIIISIFNNGLDSMEFPLEIPIHKIEPIENQMFPDRIITLLEKKGLFNVFDGKEKYKIKNNMLRVKLEGKSYKILSV